MKTVYILRDEDRLGPFQPSDVQKLLNTGQLHRDEPAWTEGAPDWEPLRTVLPRAMAAPGDPVLCDLAARSGTLDAEKKRRPFLIDLPHAFWYPFRGHGPYLLVAGTVALCLAGAFTSLPGRQHGYGNFLFLITVAFVVSYYAGCLMEVIRTTASGDNELTDTPDIVAVDDEMSRPLLQILGTVTGCWRRQRSPGVRSTPAGSRRIGHGRRRR